jgi:hypothetical protein
VEPEDSSIARQRLSKQAFSATDTQATTGKFLVTMISVRSVQSDNKRKELVNWGSVGMSRCEEKILRVLQYSDVWSV